MARDSGAETGEEQRPGHHLGKMNSVQIVTFSDDLSTVNIGSAVARIYHHGALAEAIVEQALAEVRLHGADHVSLRGISQLLEVSPSASAAYNHFADKDELLRAVGSCGLAALDEYVTRVLTANPGNTPRAARARFSGLGRAYLSFAIDEKHLFQLTFGGVRGAGPGPGRDGFLQQTPDRTR